MRKYKNLCETCGHTWESEACDTDCPECGEYDDMHLQTDFIIEE